MDGCTFYAHRICFEQISEFIGSNLGSGLKSLQTQIRKICTDPDQAGERLKSDSPAIQGRVYKIWVRGDAVSKGKGHRLIYITVPAQKAALGVHFSLELRSEFSYEDVDWQALAEQVVKDFTEERIEAFHRIDVPTG